MRDADNIRDISALGVDMIGLIFYPPSPRYVQQFSSGAGIIPDYAPYMGKTPLRVGVFVDDMPQNIVTRVYNYKLDYIQLHGNEPRETLENLRATIDPDIKPKIKIIKAISVSSAEDIKKYKEYVGAADLFLFDTKCKTVGGSGELFDWQVLQAYDGDVPFLLSGGIGPDDAERIQNFHHPKCIGIDLNSKFEIEPAFKDVEKLKQFLVKVKKKKGKKVKIKQTMNKINQLFESRKDRKLLSLYFCAGCPTLEGTGDVIKAMERHGIDMIEVGIPFSDPLADGPVIQSAGTRALKNGMTVKTLFGQLKAIKGEVSLPLVLMGYLNPIMHFGIEAFFKECVEAGVSGTIIPDLPFDDYLKVVKPTADKYDIRVIMMITPETSEERIRFIDEHTDGFIYMVSSASITGAQSSFGDAKLAYFNHINGMKLRNPRMIGFGISNKQTLTSAQDNAAGAIIGSKFVTLLNETLDPDKALDELFEALKK